MIIKSEKFNSLVLKGIHEMHFPWPKQVLLLSSDTPCVVLDSVNSMVDTSNGYQNHDEKRQLEISHLLDHRESLHYPVE